MSQDPFKMSELIKAKNEVEIGTASDEVKQAVKAIEIAGRVMEAISNGKMIDIAYYKTLMESFKKEEPIKERKVPKNSRKYRKSNPDQ